MKLSPDEAVRRYKARSRNLFISLKDAAAFFEQQGLTRDDLTAALRAGLIESHGIPVTLAGSTTYHNIELCLVDLVSAAARTLADREGEHGPRRI